MDHQSAVRVLRLSDLETRAWAHHDRAIRLGNQRLGFRASKLLDAVRVKQDAPMFAEVSTYRD